VAAVGGREGPPRIGHVASLTVPVVVRERSRFAAVAAAAPVVLLLAHALPAEGPGLALRIAAAAACVLILPGALILRAVAWPASPGIAVAASFALSLAVVAFALALVFAAAASVVLAAVVLAFVTACAAVPAALVGRTEAVTRAERNPALAVLAASVPLAGVVWWAAGPLGGDGFFHAARARKLAELDMLTSLGTVNEFRDGGLHPGYAFPLWHEVDALVARLAGVDVVDIVLYLPAILVPLALLLAYGAGVAVFRSWAGGLALVAAQVAQLGFAAGGARAGTGAFELLSLPPTAGRALFAPAMLALAFAYAVEGGWPLLGALGASAFALSAVHPSYTPYVAVLVAAFVVTRALLVRGWEPLLTRAVVAAGAILVPFGLFLLVLYPVVRSTAAHSPSAERRASELAHYGNAFTRLGDSFGFSPDAIARGGPVVVAGLLAVPLAALAARRLWAALVLGGSLAVLTLLLFPPFFTLLSDAFSLSQSRRLTAFLPIAFAVAGACILASRLRLAGVAMAAGAAVLFELLYPGEFTYRVKEGGPGWTVWIAVLGGLVALGAGALLCRRGPDPTAWAVATAVAFTVPIAVAGLADLKRPGPTTALTPGIVEAVRGDTAPGDVLFADPETAYEIAAFAPVYINSAPIGHVASTPANRPKARRADARRFFLNPTTTDGERREILARYQAGWVLVDKRLRHPEEFLRDLPLVYQDGRYALYRVSS
jgi:hypothetical protein